MENIVDCGNYGYCENGDYYDIYEWDNGWDFTGFCFGCTEAEAKEFCERYKGYGGVELAEEMNLI